MENELISNELENKEVKKRGRKVGSKNKENKLEDISKREKFVLNLRGNVEALKKIREIHAASNKKEYGSEVTPLEIFLYGLMKLSEKDIPKLKEASLNQMERFQIATDLYNKENGTQLSVMDFIEKNINKTCLKGVSYDVQ